MNSIKPLYTQLIKFLFVGGSAFVIDFGVLWILTNFVGMHYLLSNIFAFTVSVVYNYILSALWVFDVKCQRKKHTEFVVFVILSLIGLGINQLILWMSVTLINLNYLISKIIATFIVMIYNFISRKIFFENSEGTK